jgi:hypothetical protein
LQITLMWRTAVIVARSLSANKRRVEHKLAGIVFSLANKLVLVAGQVLELRMQHIGAVTPAKMGCCVGNCHENRVTPGFMLDEEAIGIGAAVGSCAKIYIENIAKLIREARVSRQTALPELAGLAAWHLHNPGLVVLRTH